LFLFFKKQLTNAMQVKFADEQNPERLGDHKLFIGMLPKTTTEEELRPVFERYGQIESLTILRGFNDISKGMSLSPLTRTRAHTHTHSLSLHISSLPFPHSPFFVHFLYLLLLFVSLWILSSLLILLSTVFLLLFLFLFLFFFLSFFFSFFFLLQIRIVGCAFVKYTSREEALQAIQFLNGTHTMEGSTNPIVVKFADTPRQKEMRRQTQVIVPLQQQLQQLQQQQQPIFTQSYVPAPAINPYFPGMASYPSSPQGTHSLSLLSFSLYL
jgi:CUG-BP- and ETR3-like factor